MTWKKSTTIGSSAIMSYAIKKSLIDLLPIRAKVSLLGLFMSFLKIEIEIQNLGFFVIFKHFIQLTPYLLLRSPKKYLKSIAYPAMALVISASSISVVEELVAGMESLFTCQ